MKYQLSKIKKTQQALILKLSLSLKKDLNFVIIEKI
jgi:hypothetical protein